MTAVADGKVPGREREGGSSPVQSSDHQAAIQQRLTGNNIMTTFNFILQLYKFFIGWCFGDIAYVSTDFFIYIFYIYPFSLFFFGMWQFLGESGVLAQSK